MNTKCTYTQNGLKKKESQAKNVVIGTENGSAELPGVQIAAVESGAEAVEPQGRARGVGFLDPLGGHVNVIELKRVGLHGRVPRQLEVVVDVHEVVERFSVDLVSLLRVDLLKRIPVPLEREAATNLAQDSDRHSLQHRR